MTDNTPAFAQFGALSNTAAVADTFDAMDTGSGNTEVWFTRGVYKYGKRKDDDCPTLRKGNYIAIDFSKTSAEAIFFAGGKAAAKQTWDMSNLGKAPVKAAALPVDANLAAQIRDVEKDKWAVHWMAPCKVLNIETNTWEDATYVAKNTSAINDFRKAAQETFRKAAQEGKVPAFSPVATTFKTSVPQADGSAKVADVAAPKLTFVQNIAF